MRKLTPDEERALEVLRRFERGWCLEAGSSTSSILNVSRFRKTIRGLERKGLVRIEETEAGPRFHAT